MERHTLTTEQQAVVDAWNADPDNAAHLVAPIMPGTNIVIGDQIEIGGAWWLQVLGGNGGMADGYIYVPDWDYIGDVNFLDDVTDRIGPNGETMPVIDPVQMEAMRAAQAAKNPKHAAHGHHAAPRTMQDLLDAQTPETRAALEEQLKKHHLLHGKKP